VIKTFAPKLQRQTEMIQGDAKAAVKALACKMKEKKLL
jgi:hypothetical protein